MKRFAPVLLASCFALLTGQAAFAAKKVAKPAVKKEAITDVSDIDPNDPGMKIAVKKAPVKKVVAKKAPAKKAAVKKVAAKKTAVRKPAAKKAAA